MFTRIALCTLNSGTCTVTVRVRLTGPGACRFSLFKAAAALAAHRTVSTARAYRVIRPVCPVRFSKALIASLPVAGIFEFKYYDTMHIARRCHTPFCNCAKQTKSTRVTITVVQVFIGGIIAWYLRNHKPQICLHSALLHYL